MLLPFYMNVCVVKVVREKKCFCYKLKDCELALCVVCLFVVVVASYMLHITCTLVFIVEIATTFG